MGDTEVGEWMTMKEINWIKTGRVITREGTTIIYYGEGTPYDIESRKRHIPHANGSGTWDHTSYVVLQGEKELVEKQTLRDAKEWVQKAMEKGGEK